MRMRIRTERSDLQEHVLRVCCIMVTRFAKFSNRDKTDRIINNAKLARMIGQLNVLWRDLTFMPDAC